MMINQSAGGRRREIGHGQNKVDSANGPAVIDGLPCTNGRRGHWTAVKNEVAPAEELMMTSRCALGQLP